MKFTAISMLAGYAVLQVTSALPLVMIIPRFMPQILAVNRQSKLSMASSSQQA